MKKYDINDYIGVNGKNNTVKLSNSKVYSYILMYNDCSTLSDPELPSSKAWKYITTIANSGCTFGRGMAGSFFFTSTADRIHIANFLKSLNMEFVLYCTTDNTSITRVVENKEEINSFLKRQLKQ